jgi:putative hydrolase of the HAD superfamily
LRPYLFFDAGWTLVFPDYDVLDEVVAHSGYAVARADWDKALLGFSRYYDQARSRGEERWSIEHFCEWVLERAGVRATDVPPLARELQRRDAEKSLWSLTHPWVFEALGRLSADGYRMSVISNADGRVRQGLESLGLAGYFEHIFDSHIVGYAKPDRRLFEHALARVGASTTEALYVGDLYWVDVLGANQAGVAAVHLDPFGWYEGLPGVHLPSVAELPDLLRQGPDLSAAEFFPLR